MVPILHVASDQYRHQNYNRHMNITINI